MSKKRFLVAFLGIILLAWVAYAATNKADWGDSVYIDSSGVIFAGQGISMGADTRTSWGSVISPMTDYIGYVAPTDSGSNLKLHDDGDLTLGGAVATDVQITFDGNAQDFYIGLDDTADKLLFGYGSVMDTTEMLTLEGGRTITISDGTTNDFQIVFDGGVQDFHIGIDNSGGVEADLFVIGRGNAVGTNDDFAIGKATGVVYVNHLDAPGGVDLDIGSADVTDVTIETDGGIIILDGTITLTDGEIISNPTDDTVRIESDNADITLEVYGGSSMDAILALTSDASGGNGDDWTIKNDNADSNNLIFQNDTTGSAATKLTLGKTGIVTTTNYIESKITDTNTASVVDVMQLTHDGGTAAAGVGVGLVFKIDDAGGIEEHASIDIVLTDVTDSSEDADFIINLNQAGTMREVLRIDSDLGDTGTNVFEFTSWTTETNGVVDVLELTLDNTADTATDNFGLGISIILEQEDSGTPVEQASIDFVLTDAGTNAEDCDVIFSQVVAGALEERVRFDADDDTILLTGTTPKMTIGDGGDEDAILTFDGQTNDFYIGFDTTDDFLNIGVGDTPGTTAAIEIDANANVIIVTSLRTPVGAEVGTNTLDINESFKLVVLNHATEFITTLPAVSTASGVTYRFVLKLDPNTGAMQIVTDSSENKIYGSATVNGAAVGAVGQDTITFTASAALIGDWVELTSDGTYWYVSGQAVASTGIVFSGS